MTKGTDITKFARTYRERNEGDFPESLELKLQKESDLKYGENPNQHGAIYVVDSAWVDVAQALVDKYTT